MKEDKIVERIDDGLERIREHNDINEVAQAFYNERKDFGLFTLDDIEIDEDKLSKILYDEVDYYNETPTHNELAKAIADKKPIKFKEG